jgi:hypothetical protein
VILWRALDKTVCRWPLAVAVDAGSKTVNSQLPSEDLYFDLLYRATCSF